MSVKSGEDHTVIDSNYITDNCGGGINVITGDNCQITNNYITNNIEGRGIGLHTIDALVSGNVIAHNGINMDGGGISMILSNALLINNTIAYNFGSIGCGVYCSSSILQMVNNICWGNQAWYHDDEIYIRTSDSVLISYCDIKGGFEGEGNIDCNPAFCKPLYDNFKLCANSCCLGAGESGTDIGALGVGCTGIEYIPGDCNMALGPWPPTVIGGDVTYLVGYFIGGGQEPCNLDGFWASADINGDCLIIGSDVTALVAYFVAGGSITYCPDYPPAWPPVPDDPPAGWPNCDTPVMINGKVIPTGAVK